MESSSPQTVPDANWTPWSTPTSSFQPKTKYSHQSSTSSLTDLNKCQLDLHFMTSLYTEQNSNKNTLPTPIELDGHTPGTPRRHECFGVFCDICDNSRQGIYGNWNPIAELLIPDEVIPVFHCATCGKFQHYQCTTQTHYSCKVGFLSEEIGKNRKWSLELLKEIQELRLDHRVEFDRRCVVSESNLESGISSGLELLNIAESVKELRKEVGDNQNTSIDRCASLLLTNFYGPRSFASGLGIEAAFAKKTSQFAVHVRDYFGRKKEVEVDSFYVLIQQGKEKPLPFVVRECLNATYRISYTPQTFTEVTISVKMDNQHITDSPFCVKVYTYRPTRSEKILRFIRVYVARLNFKRRFLKLVSCNCCRESALHQRESLNSNLRM